MRAQDNPVGHVERILHVAGGVVGGDVQRLKTVIIRLHFGAGHDVIAEALEDVANFFHHQSHGMERSLPRQAARQTGVEAGQRGGFLSRVERRLLALKKGGQAFLDAVGGLSEQRALGGLKLGKASHDAGDAALAPEKIHSERFHFLQ